MTTVFGLMEWQLGSGSYMESIQMLVAVTCIVHTGPAKDEYVIMEYNPVMSLWTFSLVGAVPLIRQKEEEVEEEETYDPWTDAPSFALTCHAPDPPDWLIRWPSPVQYPPEDVLLRLVGC